ncbi:MAG TPA: hypothetical protein VF158_08465 [Longimicrobiales bacterium]
MTTTLEWHHARDVLPEPDRDVLVVLAGYAVRRATLCRYEPAVVDGGQGLMRRGHRWWPRDGMTASQVVDARDQWAYVVLPDAPAEPDTETQGRLIEAVGL